MLTGMAALTQANSPRVHRWTYTAEAEEVSVVLPDGCVDLVVLSCGSRGREVLHVTDWDFAPRLVRLDAGTCLTGYRLQPGTTLDLAEIEIAGRDVSTLETEIDDLARHDQEVSEIIDALCLTGNSVHRVARLQGVSERTLQRRFRDLSLPIPAFWRQLGRARQAVQALPSRVPLAEIAAHYGYSDQAHMTREFVRWFGRTPVQLRRNPAALADLAQPGLGNWSGEISLKIAGLA
ncbi:AraC family transcriptional regulator [Hyphomonas sp. WL0036]|uniref:helix-turn-helix domain-containing protein n=1 Tax=Hyphomonas sediminis TaxID=2866160 RepID=UPI001C8257A1|nr:AraC family transcriptional regulator [Hyphomonas sediminis]MBY9065845.1 AraC family transcriptional regulator [Hyphomonas sediminis]